MPSIIDQAIYAWKRLRFALGTPGVMLMSSEDMYAHVATFIEVAKNYPDAIETTHKVWRTLGRHLVKRAKSSDWEHFLASQTKDQMLFWARIIGGNVKRAQTKGSPYDAMATQLLAIYLRARTMDNPIAVTAEQLLYDLIDRSGIDEPFDF